MKIDAIILAAGKGKRMQSACQKYCNKLPESFAAACFRYFSRIKSCQPHIVVGDQASLVKASVSAPKNSKWSKQAKQLGTGHAVKQSLKGLRAGSIALILYGDVPLVKSSTMNKLVKAAGKAVSLCFRLSNKHQKAMAESSEVPEARYLELLKRKMQRQSKRKSPK